MSYIVEAKQNPLIIKEGKFINNLIKKTTTRDDIRIYDPKTKRMIKGQEAIDLIDDLNNNRFISSDIRIIDPEDKPYNDKEDNSEIFKKAKTVKYKEVK